MNFIQQTRRKFLKTGIAGFCAALFTGLPRRSFAKFTSNDNRGIVIREGEGIHILTGRRKVPITIKISKTKHGIDGISFCVEDQAPGRKMRIHKHLNNDELIFIHKGQGTLTLDEESIEVKTGDSYLFQGACGTGWTIQAKRICKWFFSTHQPDLKNIL